MTAPAPTGQQILDRSVELGIAPMVVRVMEALLSPRPLEALEWLASVETDAEARFGFETAAQLYRAREAH